MSAPSTSSQSSPASVPNRTALIVFAWLWVGLPFAYGVWQLLTKVVQLFTG